jgi:predicted nucleic acid-binding protein
MLVIINLTGTSFMTDKLSFLDSNILIYLVENNADKKAKVLSIISTDCMISTQVVGENINACMRKLKMTKEKAFKHANELLATLSIKTIQPSTIEAGMMICNKYQLSWWDSLIVAAALENNCEILYSEDMQDGLVIEKRLTIVNPFR